jgi:putative membrane protein
MHTNHQEITMQNNQVLKKLLAVGVLAVMFGAPGVQAQTAQPATSSGAAKLSAADKKGITDMAIANMAEVETGKLALSKSQNAEVKTFAQQMVDDHGKALADVQALAQAKGVTLPTELDAKHKALAAKLDKANGTAFDKAYTKQGGVAAHKETLAKLQKASKAAKDADVKGQVDKTIPVVQEHLKHAEQVAGSKMGSTGSSGAAGTTGASH